MFRNFCGDYITKPLIQRSYKKIDYVNMGFPDIKPCARNYKIK